MKFRAVINDHVFMREFSNIVSTLSKSTKDCTLNIQPNKLVLIINEESSLTTPLIWCEIKKDAYFSEYIMEGITPEYNEIFMSFNPVNLARALAAVRNVVKYIKIKLMNKSFPCLSVEIKVPSSNSMQDRKIDHDIPITILPRRDWTEFSLPRLPRFQTIVTMPSLKSIRHLVDKMKNLSPYITFCTTNSGDLSLVVETEMATVASHYKNLRIEECQPEPENSNMNGDDCENREEISCQIESKKLAIFLTSNQFQNLQMCCCLKQDHIVKLFIQIREDVILNCIISTVCL